MRRQFPRAMLEAASMPGIKRVFVLDFEKPRAHDCDNCGGMGYLYIFAATKGPFQGPGAPYRDNEASKFFDGKWWVGSTAGFTCPVCNGLGYVDRGNVQADPAPTLQELDAMRSAFVQHAETLADRMQA